MPSTITLSALSVAPDGPLTPAARVLLELADDRLVLGHRLSEWCGHGPMLEEDIALSNIALDLIGHATTAYSFVAEKINAGQQSDTNPSRSIDADTFAFLRDANDFANIPLVELPNGDFAQTIARQFLFDAYQIPLLELLVQVGNNLPDGEQLTAWATKTLKEDRYHLRHSSQWIIRLGDGTAESKQRITEAFEFVWRHTGELTEFSPALRALLGNNALTAEAAVRDAWQKTVQQVFQEATLVVPANAARDAALILSARGRSGDHSEFLGLMLSEMQVLPRTYPGATW